MTTINKITELKNQINNANTANADGRQVVANACKKLYNLIEEDVHAVGSEWMLPGMYNDLCSGNFAEPFMCEQKKVTFLTVEKVYIDRILPRL
jgi:hypothetical protein